jgi:hypothetical protein
LPPRRLASTVRYFRLSDSRATNYRTPPQMAKNPADRALSDSENSDVKDGKAIVPQRDGELSTAVEAAQDFVAASRSKATLRAYKSDWHDFEKWCEIHCLITLPASPQTVAAYTLRPRRPPNFYCHPGRAGGTPMLLEDRGQWPQHHGNRPFVRRLRSSCTVRK